MKRKERCGFLFWKFVKYGKKLSRLVGQETKRLESEPKDQGKEVKARRSELEDQKVWARRPGPRGQSQEVKTRRSGLGGQG